MNSCLYVGTVRHRRHRPTVHDFRYRVFLFYLDLDELARVSRKVWPFSVNRFNLVSFRDCDYIDQRTGSTKEKVVAFLRHHGLDLADGKVFLLTSCRTLGYSFNPISLYYCHARSGRREAVVAEVTNTFGERYLYFLEESASNPATGQTHGRYVVRKAMHVSPFISMDASYDFHVPPVGDRFSVGIIEREGGARVLDAQLWGQKVPLTGSSLVRRLATYPLMTVKTIAAIHFEALRLYLKGVSVYRAPAATAAHRRQRRWLGNLEGS